MNFKETTHESYYRQLLGLAKEAMIQDGNELTITLDQAYELLDKLLALVDQLSEEEK